MPATHELFSKDESHSDDQHGGSGNSGHGKRDSYDWREEEEKLREEKGPSHRRKTTEEQLEEAIRQSREEAEREAQAKASMEAQNTVENNINAQSNNNNNNNNINNKSRKETFTGVLNIFKKQAHTNPYGIITQAQPIKNTQKNILNVPIHTYTKTQSNICKS